MRNAEIPAFEFRILDLRLANYSVDQPVSHLLLNTKDAKLNAKRKKSPHSARGLLALKKPFCQAGEH